MRQALPRMIGPAEAKRCDASKNELHPGYDWQRLAYYPVHCNYALPYLAVDSFLEVKLQVDSHGDLGDQHEHNVRDEVGVNIAGELSAFMLVAKEVAYDGEDRA